MAISWLPRSSIQPSASTSRQSRTSTRSSKRCSITAQVQAAAYETVSDIDYGGSKCEENPHSFSTCSGSSESFRVRAFVTTTIMDHRLTVTYKACHSSGENITSRWTVRGRRGRQHSISNFAIAELLRTRQIQSLQTMARYESLLLHRYARLICYPSLCIWRIFHSD